MDLQRQEYPALLATLQPEQAINVLNNRVALIGQINASIADYLQERRRIEERYAADLRRLAKRPQQDSAAALGVFQLPWQRIVSGTESLAQSHETLASKIETDVEIPLKQYATKNREMQNITTIQGNLSSIARDWTKAKEKADKLSAKGSKKAGEASSGVDEATRDWESQSPYVFEQLQSLDEHRINHLRDVLTQFQTHEVDQIERNRASAESCLNALLNIETADEIKTFAAKIQQGGFAQSRRPSLAASEVRPTSSSAMPPMPPPPRNVDGRPRGASSEDRLAPEATPQKSKMGGLRRLGTVMSRRKSAAPPPPQSAEKKREKTRSMMPFRRGDSSRSFQDLEETGRDLTPVTSRAEQASIAPEPSVPDTPKTTKDAAELPASASPNGQQNLQKDSSKELPLPSMSGSTQGAQGGPPTITQLPFEGSGSTTTDPFAPTNSEAITAGIDSEESARNLKIRDQPIQEDAGEAQLAMSNMASQLRMQAQNSNMRRNPGSVRGRRDVRNTMFISGNQEIAGLSQFSNGVAPAATTESSNSIGVPSTLPATQAFPSSSTLDTSTVKRSGTGLGSLDDHTTLSDSTSIHSAQSLTTTAQHPELHEPGLNASIVETVNTWFSETGITRSFVVGEIAFSYINKLDSTPQEQETIRVDNFQNLERAAANPTFVTALKSSAASAEEQAGTYTVSLPAIRRSVPTVGLKYQLHLDDASLTHYSPLLITPAWQIVQGQASVIVLYSLNPAFKLPTSAFTGEITLKNVAISVSLDMREASSVKPTSAMMAPTQGASFRRKAGSVIWRFQELKVHAQQERLLVRFMVDGELAKKGAIEVKFELPDAIVSNLGVEKSSSTAVAETDPFADTDTNAVTAWTAVPTKKLTVSGKYSAA